MAGDAWARFADTVGRALQQLALDLRAGRDSSEVGASQFGQPPSHHLVGLGQRQEQVLLVLAGAPGSGMTTREVTDAIGYDTANAWTVLRRLEEMALVELVQGSRPQRWRLTNLGRSQAEAVPPAPAAA